MDKESLDNWQTIKDKLEEAGKTDNQYYRRACAIVAGKDDPMKHPDLEE